MSPPAVATDAASTPAMPSAVPTVVVDVTTPTWWSGRIGMMVDGASTTEEDSVTKAMRRKAELNFDSIGIPTSSKPKSFLSFSTPTISSKLNSVGIKLRSNKKDISISSNVLRHMEFERLTVISKVSTLSHTTYLDDEEVISTIDYQLLSHLISKVLAIIMDEASLS
jgi:hypothetical protein